jgi:hypothetical protein
MFIKKTKTDQYEKVLIQDTYEPNVIAYVEKYFKQFPYCAYMTKVTKQHWIDEHTETPVYEAELWRRGSCD